MAEIGFRNSVKNLKKFDKATQELVIELYEATNKSLKALIVNDSLGLREAQNRLMKEFDAALASTDFVNTWRTGTVKTIVDSTYIATTLGMSKNEYANKLYRTSLFKDKVTLSQRIRQNANKIVSAQRTVLKTALKEGRNVAQIAREINALGGFKEELPLYLERLKDSSIQGKKLSAKALDRVQGQINKIKTPGLKSNYQKLFNAIEAGRPLDTLVGNAMVARTSYYSNRLARTETINTLAEVKNEEAMQNENTQWVRNVLSSGPNVCPYCIAVTNLGWVPVENATIATHHPNCSCTSEYKMSSKKPKKWSDKTYESRLNTEINAANNAAKAASKPKTYIKPETPINLRDNTLIDRLNNPN